MTALAAGSLDRPVAVLILCVAAVWIVVAIALVARGDRRG